MLKWGTFRCTSLKFFELARDLAVGLSMKNSEDFMAQRQLFLQGFAIDIRAVGFPLPALR